LHNLTLPEKKTIIVISPKKTSPATRARFSNSGEFSRDAGKTPSLHAAQRQQHYSGSLEDDLLLYDLAVAAPTSVVVRAVLVPHLAAALAAAVLAPLDEAGVPVRPDDAVVEPRAVNVAHAHLRVLPGIILNETKAARGLIVFVEAHDDALDVTRLAEELVDLFLRRVEGEVADVQCGGEQQAVLLVHAGALKMLISI